MKSIKEILQGNLLIFTLGDVMRQLSMFITFPYFSLYILTLGGGTVEIGLINSLRSLTALFVYPVAGYIADRYNRVKIIVAANYVNAAIYLIFLLATDWKFLALGNFLMGLTVLQFPAMNSLLVDSLPSKKRGVGYSLWNAIPGAVGIISPFIGGYLITILGIDLGNRFLYGLTVVAIIGISVMNQKFLKDIKMQKKDASRIGFLQILLDSYREVVDVLRWLPLRLRVFALMLISSFFINNITGPFWVVYAVENIGLSELNWGIILLVGAVINAGLLIPAGIIVDKVGVKKVLAAALGMSSLPLFLFPFSQTFLETVLIIAAITFANVFLIAGAPAFMAHAVPTKKTGSVMAALGQGMLLINTRGGAGGPGMGAALTIPAILGALLGGFIYNYNPMLPWILMAISMIISALLCVVFISENNKLQKIK